MSIIQLKVSLYYNKNYEKGKVMHEIVSSDWFMLITGLCSIVGLLLAIFATTNVIKINNQLNIKNQTITVNGSGNTTAGGNNGTTGR